MCLDCLSVLIKCRELYLVKNFVMGYCIMFLYVVVELYMNGFNEFNFRCNIV